MLGHRKVRWDRSTSWDTSRCTPQEGAHRKKVLAKSRLSCAKALPGRIWSSTRRRLRMPPGSMTKLQKAQAREGWLVPGLAVVRAAELLIGHATMWH